MAIHKTAEAYPIIKEVAHPHVTICFDIDHLQLSEGNITNNLKLGLEKDWIRLVQIGETPGRRERGTEETGYTHIFRTLGRPVTKDMWIPSTAPLPLPNTQ
jgi:hydroxypyruvate isomerase